MRILLLQTSFLGDTILSTPLIAGIKQLHPQSELWIMTTKISNELIKNDPLLSGQLIYDKRAADAGITGLLRKAREIANFKFDRVYSLHRSARSALLLYLAAIPQRIGFKQASLSFLYTQRQNRAGFEHDVLRNLALLCGESELLKLDQELRLFAPAIEQVGPLAAEFLKAASAYVVVVPGSAWNTKMWHWENYREVVKQLCLQGKRVLLLGSQQEYDVAQAVCQGLPAVNMAGKISLSESMLLMQRAQLAICNDSMALHMASAFKVPTVAIFCSTSPSFGFGPWRNRALIVEHKNLACKPCGRHGFRACPLQTEACMREVSPSLVLEAAAQLISGEKLLTA